MNKHGREALDAYYAEAASWNRDRVEALALLAADRLVDRRGARPRSRCSRRSRSSLLMPLKTVEPYTLMVDRTTGYVQALKPLDPAKISPDAALTQSLPRPICDRARELRHRHAQTQLPQGRLVVGRDGAKPTICSRCRSRTRRARSRIYPRTTIDRNAGEERVADRRQHGAGAVRDSPQRRRRRSRSRRALGSRSSATIIRARR